MISAGNNMGAKRIAEAFHKLGKFSEEDFLTLAHYLQAHSFPRGFHLLKEGAICQTLYFVVKGSFRHFEITDKGEEITRNFYLKKDWMLDYKSLTSQTPSAAIIEAWEASDVLELSVYDLHKLMKLADVFFQVGRVFQYGMAQQEVLLQNATPKERYRHLLRNKPQVIQRFPLKCIASYLGMTPETLSRVRRSLTA